MQTNPTGNYAVELDFYRKRAVARPIDAAGMKGQNISAPLTQMDRRMRLQDANNVEHRVLFDVVTDSNPSDARVIVYDMTHAPGPRRFDGEELTFPAEFEGNNRYSALITLPSKSSK